jgi:hypothetical protein
MTITSSPAKVASVGKSTPVPQPQTPPPSNHHLLHLAKWMLIAIGLVLSMAMWLALITMANTLSPREQVIDCRLAEFHPDYTPSMREACRSRAPQKHYKQPKNEAGQTVVFDLSCPGRDKAGQIVSTHLQTRMVEPFFCPVFTGTERDRPICPAVPGYLYPGQVGHAMKLEPQKA